MNDCANISSVKQACTGCKLCAFVCPQQAIQFEVDYEGFWYPKVSTNCNNCGACVKKCPVLSPVESFSPPEKCFAGWHSNSKIHQGSSSGGVFSAFADFILETSGVVYGVEMTKSFSAKHVRVENKEQLVSLRRSKYIQSDCNIYADIEKDLEVRRVLFCGCPCQVAAVKQAFSQKPEKQNLFCIDFVCNSVNSPMLFKLYCQLQEQSYASSIKEVLFRDKNIRNTVRMNLGMTFRFSNGDEVRSDIYTDPWYAAFMLHYYIRKSCYNCRFAGSKRQGDITIGDFWGVPATHYHPDGVSLIFTNTKSGEEFFSNVDNKLNCFEQPFYKALRQNPRLITDNGGISERQQRARRRINELIARGDIGKLFNHFLRGNYILKLAFFAKYCIDRVKYFYCCFYYQFYNHKK